MASYNPPVVGKIGVRSGVSKKLAFGICCDSKKEALAELRSRIGRDSLKWRWKTASWNKEDLKQYEEYKQEMKELKEEQEVDRREKREKAIFIRNNIDKLTDEYKEKFEKSFVYEGETKYHHVRSAYTTLNQWLERPERVKERSDG